MAYDTLSAFTPDSNVSTSGAFNELSKSKTGFNPLSGLRATAAEKTMSATDAVSKAEAATDKLEKKASNNTASAVPGLRPPGSGNPIFQMLGGILYYDGKPYSGKQGNKTYSGGRDTTPPEDNGSGLKTSDQLASDALAAERKAERQSAYDLLYSEFAQYGLASLVEPLKGLITSGASPAEFTIRLRESDAYKKRFSGNAQRISNGLMAIDERTYLATEDKYQALMRNYGLPSSYWSKDEMGTQQGFTNLIANDVSAVELESRLQTAQNRVLKANPEISFALKEFYPDITNGDILAYVLDPKNALDVINRKVTAAEIGGAALSQGLTTSLAGAESLAGYGVTKDQAQQGYQTIAGFQPRAGDLASFYNQQEYTQATAEAEVFGTLGAAEAKKKREKLISLEKASFEGKSGLSQGALSSNRSSNRIQYTTPGAGAY